MSTIMNNKKLTKKQGDVLGFIKGSIEKTGNAPTVREVQSLLGCASPMGAVSHITSLERKGYIRKVEGKKRGIILVMDGNGRPLEDIVQIPLVGNVACGMPIFAEELIEEWIPLSTKILRSNPADVFMLRAKGDSMNLAGIEDGDFVIIRKQSHAEEGDKVVALIGTEATVKKIHYTKEGVTFIPMSTNPEHKEIIPEQGTFMVQGKVIGVIKNFKV